MNNNFHLWKYHKVQTTRKWKTEVVQTIMHLGMSQSRGAITECPKPFFLAKKSELGALLFWDFPIYIFEILWECYLWSTCGVIVSQFDAHCFSVVFCLQHGCCICCTTCASGLFNLSMEKYIDRKNRFSGFVLTCDYLWYYLNNIFVC